MSNANANQLSEIAKQNLERNAELRKIDSKFVSLQPGEKVTLLFDAERVEPVQRTFEDGKTVQRFQYTVKNPNEIGGHEKLWTVSKRTSEQIDAFLIEGARLLKIQRIGLGKETRYNIMAA
jgi:hypothetical protein